MSQRLEDTDAGAVAMAIASERFLQGSSAIGRVLTLVIVGDESSAADATKAAVGASREHPCRILVAIPRPGRGPARLDAEISVGGVDGLGEVVELRMRGPLAAHTVSVVLPLLVPDAPVVVWWPGAAPAVPAQDPMGRLAQRRITDSGAASRPVSALAGRFAGYTDGDTDLAWTRITPWRALLASALDQPFDPVTSASVHVARSNPSGPLLAAWLRHGLKVPVTVTASRGPGITAVTLHSDGGEITVHRPDGRVATVSQPGFTDRQAALPRRTLEELIAEELRRLDADEVYGEALGNLAAQQELASTTTSPTTSPTKAAPKKAPATPRKRAKR